MPELNNYHGENDDEDEDDDHIQDDQEVVAALRRQKKAIFYCCHLPVTTMSQGLLPSIFDLDFTFCSTLREDF